MSKTLVANSNLAQAPANSVKANPTAAAAQPSDLSLGSLQFVGNTGSGLNAVTLSAGGGLSLVTSVANTAAIDGSYLLTLIQTLSSNIKSTFVGSQTLNINGTKSTWNSQPSGTYEVRYISGYFYPSSTQNALVDYSVIFTGDTPSSGHSSGTPVVMETGPRVDNVRFTHFGGSIQAYIVDDPYTDNSGPGVVVGLYKLNNQ